jgi:hypothetical protein
MDINLLNQLNCIYKPLWEKSVELNRDLQDLGYETSCGFYNNHSIKIDSDFYTEFFPIPVIFIEGIGDIGIDVDSIWFEVTFSKEKALGLDYHSVAKDYRFEIYGVAGYLDDIYNEHTELSDIIPNLMGNSESAFHISFYFEQSANVRDIMAITQILSV